METLFALLVIGGVIFLLVFGPDRSKRRAPQRKVEQRPPPPVFEARSAAPVSEKTTVQGTAYVIDGDSLVIEKTQIRLFGVDAPEINHPYGQKAKWALVGLCKGQRIHAEIVEQDAHGRTVAKCTLPDGRDLSAEMVRQGLAIDWPKFSGGGICRWNRRRCAKSSGWRMRGRKGGCMCGRNMRRARKRPRRNHSQAC